MKCPGAGALVFWLVFTLTASPVWANEIAPANKITLTSKTTLSSEGYFVLSWISESANSQLSQDTNNNSDTLFLLQAQNAEMQSPEIREVPASGAITVSGLDDGMYYFRIDSSNSAISSNSVSSSNTVISSNIVQIEVRHHSLHKALGFFALGLGIFIVLCLSIFIGQRLHKRDQS